MVGGWRILVVAPHFLRERWFPSPTTITDARPAHFFLLLALSPTTQYNHAKHQHPNRTRLGHRQRRPCIGWTCFRPQNCSWCYSCQGYGARGHCESVDRKYILLFFSFDFVDILVVTRSTIDRSNALLDHINSFPSLLLIHSQRN